MSKRSSSSKQLSFLADGFHKPQDCFGGSLLKNSHAKTKRPLDSKLPIHLVLRSTTSLMRTHRAFGPINQTVRIIAKKYGVRIYSYANVGNHLHILLRIKSLRLWAGFIRELTGRVAQVAQGLKGPQKSRRKFWSQRPFTRIVRGWKRAFAAAKDYIGLNILEADGHISRQETRSLKELRLIFADG